MSHKPSILASDAPRVVNDVLMKEWGVSLFKFAQVFAVSPADQILLRSNYPFSSRELRAIKRNLAAMQNCLLTRGRSISEITNRIMDPPNKVTSDEELIKRMRLEGFFEKFVHGHEKAIRYATKISLQGKRGGAINQKSIIALGWGNLISCKSRRMDWKTLGDLYYWLWEKVAGHKFYRPIKPSDGIEEYLRHQYIRHRWTQEGVLENAGLKGIGSVIKFLGTLLSHQFMGDHEDYLENKLALPRSRFPKFFMNLFIETVLAGREGLTLFSPNQSLADSGYKFLDLEQGKRVGNRMIYRALAWMIPDESEFSKRQELPYKDTEISEYLRYAANLYTEHGISLKRPAPLIIFPDRSFFSTSF